MKQLIRMGPKARLALHSRLPKGTLIQNEVVLVLGVVGDETTVPLIIVSYPAIKPQENLTERPNSKSSGFGQALGYLTGDKPIGARPGCGRRFKPGNRGRWQRWRARNAASLPGLVAATHRNRVPDDSEQAHD